MTRIKLYAQLFVGAGLIVWGAEFLPRIAARPGLAASWAGPLLVLAGAAVGGRAAYAHRRGAPLLGVALLLAASVWAWNLQSYFDPERVSGGGGPPVGLYLAPGALIALGVFFLVFFRYLYPEPAAGARAGTGEEAGGTPPAPAEEAGEPEPAAAEEAREPEAAPATAAPSSSRPGRERAGPWYRLALLAAVAVLALVVAWTSGLEDPGRSQVTILVLVLGALATGLISENTLVRLLPWRK